jgi:hypothetical protein
VVTAQVQGKAYFQSFAMNVMIEGEPAVRHLDLVTHNQAGLQPPNTPPMPWLATMNVVSPPSETSTKDEAKGPDWIEIAVEDDDGKPVSGVRYQVELPDGSTVDGVIPIGGMARLQGLPKGNCKVSFPELDAEAHRQA